MNSQTDTVTPLLAVFTDFVCFVDDCWMNIRLDLYLCLHFLYICLSVYFEAWCGHSYMSLHYWVLAPGGMNASACRCQTLASPSPAGGLYLIQMNSLLFHKRVRLLLQTNPLVFILFFLKLFQEAGGLHKYVAWVNRILINLPQITLVLPQIQA